MSIKKITRRADYFIILGIFLAGFIFSGNVFPARAAGGEWENLATSGEFLDEDGIFNSLAFEPGTNNLYVAYTRVSNAYWPVIKKYDGSSWSDVTTSGLSAKTGEISISFNPDTKKPYVFCGDSNNSGKAVVKKFDGSSWVNVGAEGFSQGSVFDEKELSHIAFQSGTNQPYVAYTDAGLDNKAVVKKFDGNSWIDAGSNPMTNEESFLVCFAINSGSNEPYVAYTGMDTERIHVKKFDGSSWVNVGSDIDSSYAINFSLAFHPVTHEPYVAYSQWDGSRKATVKKFDGSSWVNVGQPEFSAGRAMYMSLAFSPSTNEPMIVYGDDSLYYKAVAKKFDGSNWVDAGTIGQDSGDPILFDLAFNPATNEPYVIYTDMIDEPEYSYRIAVKKFNKLFTDTSTLTYTDSKKAKKKITFNFQDLNLKIKKKDVKIRLNGKKTNLGRVSKRGNNVLAAINLKYGKWARGNYNLTMTYKGKRGKTTFRGTWTANNVLTIE